MLRQCVVLAVIGCAVAFPQHQYQQQQEVPPHLLRQYIGQQQQAQAQQILQRPQHYAQAPAPARLRDPQEDYDPNPSYQFGFDVNDDQYTNYQNRKEQREGDVIKGSYSVVDSDGFIRTVNYIADPKEGFRAESHDIKGSYSVVDSDGFIRTIHYIADPKEGFRAEVSRQPTDIKVKIPTPKPQLAQPISHQPIHTQQRPQQHQPQQQSSQYYYDH
ncbi:insect cuticle protein domain-containing protein [Phthorimaea operculella]|nr:insect cuticle protein domain-containing protein [Phthorimaea operculella]